MDPRWKPIRRIDRIRDPGAGNQFTIVADRSEHWLLRSLTFTFTTDATVATRAIALLISQSGLIYQRYAAATTQVASLPRVYGAYPGASNGAVSGINIAVDCPTDGYWLPQGSSLMSGIDNIAAGDAVTSVAFEAWAFPIGPDFSMYPFVPTFIEESE